MELSLLIFFLSAKVQVMELSVSGRLKLADVSGDGRLVKLLTVLRGTLCLIFIFWLSQCKYGFSENKLSSLIYICLSCEN